MIYKILEHMPEENELDIVPSEYWILNCFFFVLREGSNTYLPLTCPIYKITKSGNIEGGLWTPPYVARKIEGTIKRLTTPKSIKKMMAQYEHDNIDKINDDISYMFYYLGVQNYELTKLSEFTEYKTSYSEPTKIKCYHIINHLVTDMDKASIVNIVDPECMRNLHFIDLNSNINNLPKRSNEKFPSYNGKVLSSNLYKVLEEQRCKLTDNKTCNIVEETFLWNEFEGILFSYDINSSGKIRNKIENDYVSLYQNGYEISEDFISNILIIFTQVLAENGIYQYRLEGDGFIAAIPKNDFELFNIKENYIDITAILKIFKKCDEEIEKLLSCSENVFSSKVAIHYGKYKYGKIGGIEARSTTFSGKELFVLSRLRDGIAKWNNKNKKNISSLGVLENSSVFLLNENNFVNLFEMYVKDSKIKIKIYTRENEYK